MKRIVITIGILLVIGFIFRPPVDGGRLSSWYGIRASGLHPGSDIAHAEGTPIRPVAPGVVKQAGNFDDDRGFFVTISHLGVVQSRYYHMNSIATYPGQSVDHKFVIGTVGNTGLSTGPHLHFEIRVIGIPLPPYLLTIPGRVVNLFVSKE